MIKDTKKDINQTRYQNVEWNPTNNLQIQQILL